MEIRGQIANRIRQLREAKELTQEELAYRSDVNRTFMNHVENQHRNISIETLSKILKGLEISFKEFFDDPSFDNVKEKKNGKK